MKRIPPLSLIVEMHLRKRFPGKRPFDLALLNSSAWCWVTRRVFDAHLEPEPPPLLVTAAMFYMFHCLEKDPKTKAAYLFNAHELLAIYN